MPPLPQRTHSPDRRSRRAAQVAGRTGNFVYGGGDPEHLNDSAGCRKIAAFHPIRSNANMERWVRGSCFEYLAELRPRRSRGQGNQIRALRRGGGTLPAGLAQHAAASSQERRRGRPDRCHARGDLQRRVVGRIGRGRPRRAGGGERYEVRHGSRRDNDGSRRRAGRADAARRRLLAQGWSRGGCGSRDGSGGERLPDGRARAACRRAYPRRP